MVEGFVDELAESAGKDPVEYRRALLAASPRARAVLDLAAGKANWGAPMPARSGRGVSLLFGFGSYVAQVAEVTVADDGKVRVNRVVCAVDCGQVAIRHVKAQIEGARSSAERSALWRDHHRETCRVQPANFDTFRSTHPDGRRRSKYISSPAMRRRAALASRDVRRGSCRGQRHFRGGRGSLAAPAHPASRRAPGAHVTDKGALTRSPADIKKISKES